MKKKKIIIIDECFQCPHFYKIHNYQTNEDELDCSVKERKVSDPFKIPSWCPLPDMPESK